MKHNPATDGTPIKSLQELKHNKKKLEHRSHACKRWEKPRSSCNTDHKPARYETSQPVLSETLKPVFLEEKLCIFIYYSISHWSQLGTIGTIVPNWIGYNSFVFLSQSQNIICPITVVFPLPAVACKITYQFTESPAHFTRTISSVFTSSTQLQAVGFHLTVSLWYLHQDKEYTLVSAKKHCNINKHALVL